VGVLNWEPVKANCYICLKSAKPIANFGDGRAR
jgi:hypothetical protein